MIFKNLVDRMISNNAKNYVLDTNILLHGGSALEGFADNNVIITGTTLQELDSKKTAPGELGYAARNVIKQIDEIRQRGNFLEGIPLNNGGVMFVEPDGIKQEFLPPGFSLTSNDNRIISACKFIEKNVKEELAKHYTSLHNSAIHPSTLEGKVILVTNDTSLKVNASVCEVEVQSYKNDHINWSEYRGYTEIELVNGWEMLSDLRDHGEIKFKTIQTDKTAIGDDELYENEFVVLKAGTDSALAIHREGKLHLIKNQTAYDITGKNSLQNFALYALKAPADEIPLVIINGAAGTGKTLLAIAAGLEGVKDGRFRSEGIYNKVLITRPNVTAERDFGYLPGELEEKMRPLLSPFYDNMEALIRNKGETDSSSIQMQIDDYFDSNSVEILPLSYIRGRSISESMLIVDEAQNSTWLQIRDIVTRAGKGTKVVLIGDMNQIDNSHLDQNNNGLLFALERMKGSKMCAELVIDEKYAIRSDLAKEALNRMKM